MYGKWKVFQAYGAWVAVNQFGESVWALSEAELRHAFCLGEVV